MTTLPELIQQSLSVLGGNINNSFSGQISELLQQQGLNMQHLWKPPIDMIETEDNLQIYMNLAGVPKESIDVDFFNNSVSVKGERMLPVIFTEPGTRHRCKEIIYGKFERKIVLPISITQRESVSITMKDGVLIITIDKTIETRNKFSLKVENEADNTDSA